MAQNETNFYNLDPRIAEIYDQIENKTPDIDLIRHLIAGKKNLRILEPFTGTGRILLKLAVDGHDTFGFDQSHHMIERSRQKATKLPASVQNHITLLEQDVIEGSWPAGFDLIILAGNCLYELATPEEQEQVIRQTASALKQGGFVYVDNDHMEGDLDIEWQNTDPKPSAFQGASADGSRIESWIQTVWFDAPKRLVRFKRWIELTSLDGEKIVSEFYQQKHPVSMDEVKNWLEGNGFKIENIFGDRDGSPYTPKSNRAIFWARKS